MKKCINYFNRISDKILIIIKDIIIPIFIFVFILNIIAQWAGCDLSSLKLMHILGLDGDTSQSVQLLAMYIGLWIVLDIMLKYSPNRNILRNEYREYLVKELEKDYEKNFDTDKLKKSADDDKENEHVVRDIIIEQSKNEKKDIIALMLRNNDEITEYFKISKTQAKSSFWFSVISCIVGMGALAIGIYGIVVLKDVSVSVISLISGSISELISGTVFWVHNKSALQLNHYYNALHENEKFLSAVNIADKLSAEKREEVLIEIIHKQINSESSKTITENTKEKEKKKEENQNS